MASNKSSRVMRNRILYRQIKYLEKVCMMTLGSNHMQPILGYESPIQKALLKPIMKLAETQEKIDTFHEELADVEEVKEIRVRLVNGHVDVHGVRRAVNYVRDQISKRPDAAIIEELIVMNKRLQPYARRLGRQLDALLNFLVACSVYKFNSNGPYAEIAKKALDSTREDMFNIITS